MRGSIGLIIALVVATGGSNPALAQHGRQSFRLYNHRMDSLLQTLDRNNDGHLDQQELQNHPALMRRLKRQGGGAVLRLDEMRSTGTGPTGERLSRRFRQADRNGDRHLSVSEARELPGISRRFKQLDRNNDRRISIDELWRYQRALAPSR